MLAGGVPAGGVPAVLRLADRQHGVVLSSQLRAGGVSDQTVRTLAGKGWLVAVRRGAWVVGRPPTSWQQVVAVGLLAGPSAALSHTTAARIHRFAPVVGGPRPEISVRYPRNSRMDGVCVHRVRDLGPRDVLEVRGVSVTTPARTLVDLAARLPGPLIATMFDEALIARALDAGEVGAVLDRLPNRRGIAHLRSLVESRLERPVADSRLEARVVAVLEPLAPFQVQHQVILDGRVLVLDVAWPEARVALESDGWAVHTRSRSKFDGDRRRDNLLAAHGWLTGHVTSAMSDHEILATAARLLLLRTASPVG